MKRIILILVAMVSLVACNQTKTDLEKQKLKGKVKSLRESEYEAVEKFEKIEKGKITETEFVIFNEQGNIIEVI